MPPGPVSPSSPMGRRPQRGSPLPLSAPSFQDKNHLPGKVRRSQQRRKNNADLPSTKCTSLQSSAQGTAAGSACRVAPPAGDRTEVQRPPFRLRERSRGPARSQHGAAGRLSDSSPAPPGGPGPQQGPEKDTDSDRDLSDTERLPPSPPSAAPPLLDLRPEVLPPDPLPPDPLGPRGRGPSRPPWSDPFPDFLPPPFNAWSLAQLASCSPPEPRPQPRPPAPLERFLERLLQLEGRRLQTEEEEGGRAGPAPRRAAARLSCPRSILQCQRAFPLSLLAPPPPAALLTVSMEATRVLELLTAVEEAAEDVLTSRQQIVDLDLKRNLNREALSALRATTGSEKVKVCFGNMFIKLPKSKTQDMIGKDQEQLDKEINDLRKELKAKVNHLNVMQGRPELTGYHLSPLSAEEVRAIDHLMKR